MGIGFEMFKLRLGDAIADGVINSFSSAMQKHAADQAEQEEIAQQESNRLDMLKTMVFMVSYNMELERSGKKAIANALSQLYDEEISLFSIEDQIDDAYSQIKDTNPKTFFSGIVSITNDRYCAAIIYTYMLYMYTELIAKEAITPAHIYNMYLIKKYFLMQRSELAECYKALAGIVQKDTDDIADMFEKLTCEAAIESLKSENLSLTYEESNIQENVEIEDSEKQIEAFYYQAISEAGENMDDFKKHVNLADKRPDMIAKAVKTYAKDCIGENAILIFDNTWTLNCKNGFVLTNKNIYIGSGGKLKQCIPLADIKFIDATVKFTSNKLTINTTEVETEQILKGTIALYNLLQNIIPLAMKVEN
ncbi:hypothetical protein E4O03_01195 [Treponema sp. OMZ 792]|uniref:hypothetical protein n=1 Tax=Treponema TaxID=157 RepID=UPI0004F6FB4A|nr:MULTISPECIES: hypothetical protein [Treponema]AIN94061.1 hypothetical protein JO40_08030 [Treponema putidum]TWI77022.1 hypothetical protein JM98_01586 [Treponema putidum]UTC75376.1 hypothetical protein E4O03_01195 [Treponema sp. OMZ 792]UTC79379.1 hypothetical protein E4O07_01220 [Treponema sp. OMZ 798]